MRERTTKKQRELLSYVEGFIKEYDYAPSYREMMQALGYKSVSTVAAHVNNLVERGYLKKGPDGIRMLELVPAPAQADEHRSWLKRELAKKKSKLQQEASIASKKDVAALERVAELFGLE